MQTIVPFSRTFFVLSFGFSLIAGTIQASAATEAGTLFHDRIYPLFVSKCLACHGNEPEKIKGGLDMRTREGLLKGGENGPVLVPGNPHESPLHIATTWQNEDLQMPPKENDRLTAAEVELVRQWIAAGAPWPEAKPVSDERWVESGPDGITIRTSGGLSPDWTYRKYLPEDVWAFQPIQRPTVPEVRASQSVQNPIDAFIQQKLEAKNLRPAPPADRLTLIRRATMDLTGLPPTPAEVKTFLADHSTDAFAQLIKRLLASPHYGEQQARHWLDVVRYADTSGFSNDFERPHAWRYRDYVVRSFNADKPYDRFLLEQLAGDELEPDNPEMLIAVGFLRSGPWEHTGMTVAAVTRQQYLDDVTHNVGAALLGQGLRCASCHDHKFDPVPTRDYYRMQAAFAATQFSERPLPFLAEEGVPDFSAAKARVETKLQAARQVQAAIRKKNQEAIAALLKERGLTDPKELSREEFNRLDHLGVTHEELSLRKINNKRQDYFERELKRFEPFAFSVYSGPPNQYSSPRPLYGLPAKRAGLVPVVHILTGGAVESPGEAVTPGVLSAMQRLNGNAEQGWDIPDVTEGRRLALAQWIVSPENTLTARVIVNRIWQQHFGEGIVATPNNFGKMGARPTHPELLDWLASWFIENGWSLKKLHALIMSSATYQQSPEHPDAVAQASPAVIPVANVGGGSAGENLKSEISNSNSAKSEISNLKVSKSVRANPRAVDPGNQLLWHFPTRRLAAEELRDSLLAITGELNRQMGGPGAFPEINWEVAFQPRHIMGSVAPAYEPSPTPAERNRRTLYAFRHRTLADPMLEVFNRPGSEVSCERRDETTVTPQALALFNSEFVHNRALAFAARIERNHRDLDQQIAAAFRLVYGRAPTAAEAGLCREHVQKMQEYHRVHQPDPRPLPTSVKRHMIEEMTGEDVHWIEELDGLKNYQRDLMPWEAGAETRALAELCLVLFNSNEFLYLR